MELTRAEAMKIRSMLQLAAESLTDEQALQAPTLFERWAANAEYEAGKRLYYDGKLYKVLQAHTSQADWTPDTAVSLYVEVTPPGVIPVWKQPTGATDAYMIGDKVRYPDENGIVYVSTVDNNVWQPGVYGWDEVWQQ